MKLRHKIAIAFIRAKFKILSVVSKKLAAEKAFELFCTPYLKTRARVPVIFEEAEPLLFSMNGLLVHGFRWNHPQNKKVLILHGFGSAAHKFHQYVGPLIEKGFEVLAFDAPAHGTSEGKRINAVEYCQMIETVISKYGPIQHFIAHSFGGMAVSLALEKIPHTAGTRVVLIAPATETSSAVDAAFKMLQLRSESIRAEFDNIILQKSGQLPAWFSIKRALQNVNASVLWFHDENDDITPLSDALKVQAAGLPNVQFVITRGLGHRKIYGDEATKKRILEFL